MTFRVVFLCTENRSDFKDTVKHADEHLFVELRALCQDSRAVEIFQLEDVCAALSAFRADLRCMDFGESLGMKKITERPYHAFLNTEFCTLSDISKSNRPHVQHCFEGGVHFPFVDCERHWLGRLGKNGDGLQPDFDAARCAVLFFDRSGYGNCRFLFQIFQREVNTSFFVHTLNESLALS